MQQPTARWAVHWHSGEAGPPLPLPWTPLLILPSHHAAHPSAGPCPDRAGRGRQRRLPAAAGPQRRGGRAQRPGAGRGGRPGQEEEARLLRVRGRGRPRAAALQRRCWAARQQGGHRAGCLLVQPLSRGPSVASPAPPTPPRLPPPARAPSSTHPACCRAPCPVPWLQQDGLPALQDAQAHRQLRWAAAAVGLALLRRVLLPCLAAHPRWPFTIAVGSNAPQLLHGSGPRVTHGGAAAAAMKGALAHCCQPPHLGDCARPSASRKALALRASRTARQPCTEPRRCPSALLLCPLPPPPARQTSASTRAASGWSPASTTPSEPCTACVQRSSCR